jgi:catechol 2,3-dioxygenase-like lactoylglutathione lyase family enzyme
VLTGIDHVQITVPRALEADCLHFYRAVLKLTEIPKPVDLRGRGGAWFQLGAVQIHIGLEAEPSPPSKRHVCFLTGDLDSARSRFEAAGVAVEDGGTAEGMTRIFIRDPAGNRLEIARR